MHRQTQGWQIQGVKEVIVLHLSHPLYRCHHSNMPGGDTREAASLTKTTEERARTERGKKIGKSDVGNDNRPLFQQEIEDRSISHTSLVCFQMYKLRSIETP